MKPVQARISDELHAAAVKQSKATGISMSHVIKQALAHFVKYGPTYVASLAPEYRQVIKRSGLDIKIG